jgi:hypothetical protein
MTAQDSVFDGDHADPRGPTFASLCVMMILVPVVGIVVVAGGEQARHVVAAADGPTIDPSHALDLCDRTQAGTGLLTQVTPRCAAAVADPANPWLTLDLARTLVKLGRLEQARKIMAESVAGGAVPSDALRAGIIFADETANADVAAVLIAQLQARVATQTDDPIDTSGPGQVRALRHSGGAVGTPATVSTAIPSAQQAYVDALAGLGAVGRMQDAVASKAGTVAPSTPPRLAEADVTSNSRRSTQAAEPVGLEPVQVFSEGRSNLMPQPAASRPVLTFVNETITQPAVSQGSQQTTAASANSANPTLTNPFRHNPDNGTRTADSTLSINPPDPVLAAIDHEMAELRDRTAPNVQGGFEYRNHSGDSGLSLLNEYSIPLRTTVSLNAGGQLRLEATPTRLTSGSIDSSTASNFGRFGSSALSLNSSGGAVSFGGVAPGNQQAEGLGLDLGYNLNSLKADVGSTPLGFRTTNVIGGVEWAPQLTDHVRLRLTGERRAVDETLLSYAGASDPRTGQTWGGVTRTGGRVQLEADAGKLNVYAAAGGSVLQGVHVQSNTVLNLQAGGFLPIWHTPEQELRTGLNLNYSQFERNLGNFTLGQGGYFSPQSYISAIVPLTYRQKVDKDFSYEVGVGVGVQSYRESGSDYFPIDPKLQALWAAKVADIPGLSATYPANNLTGLAGSATATMDYSITPSITLSARLEYQHVGNYHEAIGLLLGKYVFNGADQ